MTPVEKQRVGLMFLLIMTLALTARVLSSADAGSTLAYVFGTIACIAAFMNAEIAIHFLIIAMLLSPEVDVGGSTQGATLGRSVTLRLDDILLLIICFTWFIRSVLYKEISLLKRTPLNGAMYLYATVAVFSTMMGMSNGNVDVKTGSLFVLKYIEYFLVFWMVINTAQEESQMRRFLLVVMLVAVIVTVTAIAQVPQGHRVSAPFEGKDGEPNTLGGYLLFMMSILGGIVLVRSPFRLMAGILLVMMSIAFMYTLSRASYLALAPVALIVPFLLRRFYLVVGVLIVGLALVTFAEALLPAIVYDRVAYTFTQTSTHSAQVTLLGKRVDTSTSARLIYMQYAFDAFSERPFFGWGVTGWHFLDAQYFRTLAETGLVGLASFLFLLFRVIQITFRTFNKLHDRDPLYQAVAAGFIGGTVGLMIHAIGSNTFIIIRIMEPFWLMCGLVYLMPSLSAPAAEQAVAA